MNPNMLALSKCAVTRISTVSTNAPQAAEIASSDTIGQPFALILGQLLGQQLAQLAGADKGVDKSEPIVEDTAPTPADATSLIPSDASASPELLAVPAFFAAQPASVARSIDETAESRTPVSSSGRHAAPISATDLEAKSVASNETVAGGAATHSLLATPNLNAESQEHEPLLDVGKPLIETSLPASNPAAQPATTTVTPQMQRVEAAQVRVEPTVGGTGWKESFTENVAWIVHQGRQVAELQLNPPQLGPVEVRVILGQDQASIMFTSPHAAVREAIQAALPRLSEILHEQGVALSDASVATQSFAQQQSHEESSRQGREDARSDVRHASIASIDAMLPRSSMQLGMVDIFA